MGRRHRPITLLLVPEFARFPLSRRVCIVVFIACEKVDDLSNNLPDDYVMAHLRGATTFQNLALLFANLIWPIEDGVNLLSHLVPFPRLLDSLQVFLEGFSKNKLIWQEKSSLNSCRVQVSESLFLRGEPSIAALLDVGLTPGKLFSDSLACGGCER